MEPDEILELAQHLLGGAHLARPRVPRVLGENQRSGLRLVRVVRQPVDTDGEDRCARTQRNRCGAQRNWREAPEKRHGYPVPTISRSIAVTTISSSRSACRTLRMPPMSSVRTLIPSRARVSRYHSNISRGSSSSAKKLTGVIVADQIADTTSYEPMWHEMTSTPLPRARACSRYSIPCTFSQGRMVSTEVLGSIIRSAYALA